MKRKALLCATLALILLLSAPSAVLASGQPETVIEGTTRLPVISVTVPASVDIMINPFQMPVAIGNGESAEQIICSPAYILSTSEVPVRVDVTVTGSVYAKSDMSLVSSPTGGAGTRKNAFVYFEMQQNSTDLWEEVAWDSGYDSTKHVVVAEGVSTKKEGLVTLPAQPQEGELAENAYGWFRLSGDAARSPDEAWSTDDGISVAVAFTFIPQSYSSD